MEVPESKEPLSCIFPESSFLRCNVGSSFCAPRVTLHQRQVGRDGSPEHEGTPNSATVPARVPTGAKLQPQSIRDSKGSDLGKLRGRPLGNYLTRGAAVPGVEGLEVARALAVLRH